MPEQQDAFEESSGVVQEANDRGIPLKLRVVVRVGTTRTVATYAVTPRR